MTEWELDETLQKDTLRIGSFSTCEVLLMNDARWPWIILVPRIAGAEELHELFTDQRQDIDMEVSFVAATLKDLANCEKINIAAIGNVVRQLHIHVIARGKGDANWPGPVWGHGTKQPYDTERSSQLLAAFHEALELEHS